MQYERFMGLVQNRAKQTFAAALYSADRFRIETPCEPLVSIR